MTPPHRNTSSGRRFLDQIKAGKSIHDIAAVETLSRKQAHKTLEFAFLSLATVQMILKATQPAVLNADWVLKNAIPFDWADRVHVLHIA